MLEQILAELSSECCCSKSLRRAGFRWLFVTSERRPCETSLAGEMFRGRDLEREVDLEAASLRASRLSLPALRERGTRAAVESDSLPLAFEHRRAKVRFTRGAGSGPLPVLDRSIEARVNRELIVL